MMIGHSLLAFALVATVARALDASPGRALAAGAAAGAFAAVPDMDMVYALTGFAGAEFDGVFSMTTAFWSASTVVHRSMTHSLVVAPVAALAFALVVVQGRHASRATVGGFALLGGLTVVATTLHGLLGLVVLGAFSLAGVAVAAIVRESSQLDARTTFAVAVVGLASHPFGDLFTGEPPAMLWPLDAAIFPGRVLLSADPTLHLLGAFALELAVVWAALLAFCWVTDRRPRVKPRATAGLAYGGVFFLLPPPTLDVSYHFVFSILAVGTVLAMPVAAPTRTSMAVETVRRGVAAHGVRSVTTGLAAVTLALVAYGGLYLLV
ncbi:metal-dependent hydrolase [Haloarchaeobius sp. FL176]|uniref:metal-dependent hydrolase n=1 Tax=Haloarchaeobius sp. FL176 TaxID=2967129 RepID=UPI0021477DD4|nr:metal-dependent hydrolase [Haloarchaeobius sp. FL176]